MTPPLSKKIKWQWQKFFRALRWPQLAWRTFKQLYSTMGAKGVFWYMAVQGRWHYGVTLTLCLFSVGLLYISLGFVTGSELAAELKKASLLVTVPPALVAGFLHYVLWRRTAAMQNKRAMYLTRLYVAPILILVAVLVFAVMLQTLLLVVNFLIGFWG